MPQVPSASSINGATSADHVLFFTHVAVHYAQVFHHGLVNRNGHRRVHEGNKNFNARPYAGADQLISAFGSLSFFYRSTAFSSFFSFLFFSSFSCEYCRRHRLTHNQMRFRLAGLIQIIGRGRTAQREGAGNKIIHECKEKRTTKGE